MKSVSKVEPDCFFHSTVIETDKAVYLHYCPLLKCLGETDWEVLS